jgi:Cu-Zn family superoxide dismutase
MFNAGTIRRAVLGGALAASMAVSGGIALAQDAGTPQDVPVEGSPVAGIETTTFYILSPEGNLIANVTLSENPETGVTFDITNTQDSGLAPGEHGLHVHETGACTPTTGDELYSDAGAHFNPTTMDHGAPDATPHHAGDLGNVTVNDDGTIDFSISTTDLTLVPDAPNSLNDADGSALIIHANPDDLTTQPSGDSGDRVGCGVISPDTAGTPESTPAS